MILSHGGQDEEIETIFLIPTPGEEQATKRDEFDQKEIRTANGFSYKTHRYLPGGFVKFFESISNVFTRPARAQDLVTELQDATTLINTNACEGCDLMGLSFSGKDLSEADLTGAFLADADLTDAILAEANLTGADLNGADLNGANLSETTWLDGSICSDGSINGICNDDNLCTNTACDPTTHECTYPPVDCDDGISCTIDTCDPTAGCQNATPSTTPPSLCEMCLTCLATSDDCIDQCNATHPMCDPDSIIISSPCAFCRAACDEAFEGCTPILTIPVCSP